MSVTRIELAHLLGVTGEFMQESYVGCLVGLAIGDAVGTTVEFMPRGTFPEVKDIVGGGPFALKPGEWTDDTSMALCLAQSLLDCEDFDANDQMQKYVAWKDTGYMSSNGECFDIGNATLKALLKFEDTGYYYAGSKEPRSAGNGSLMRLAPIPMYFLGSSILDSYASYSSITTHAHPECVSACIVFSYILKELLCGNSKENAIEHSITHNASVIKMHVTDSIKNIVQNKTYTIDKNIQGTGYVVKSFEAALWAFTKGNTFKECVLLAANLGDDADTTAAITGQLAGAFYGISQIPEEWRSKVVKYDLLEDIALKLFKHAVK